MDKLTSLLKNWVENNNPEAGKEFEEELKKYNKYIEISEDGPRPYTREELIENFLSTVQSIKNGWLYESRATTVEDKMNGLVFSILVLLDGGNAAGAYKVIPSAHPSDKECHIEEGNNWVPTIDGDGFEVDIAGGLHGLWKKYEKE